MIRGWDRPTSGSPTLAGHHKWARAELSSHILLRLDPAASLPSSLVHHLGPRLPIFTQVPTRCLNFALLQWRVTFSLLLPPCRK